VALDVFEIHRGAGCLAGGWALVKKLFVLADFISRHFKSLAIATPLALFRYHSPHREPARLNFALITLSAILPQMWPRLEQNPHIVISLCCYPTANSPAIFRGFGEFFFSLSFFLTEWSALLSSARSSPQPVRGAASSLRISGPVAVFLSGRRKRNVSIARVAQG
jgi:hypothetical protein